MDPTEIYRDTHTAQCVKEAGAQFFQMLHEMQGLQTHLEAGATSAALGTLKRDRKSVV